MMEGQRTHKDLSRFTCEICLRSFARSWYLIRHHAFAHEGKRIGRKASHISHYQTAAHKVGSSTPSTNIGRKAVGPGPAAIEPPAQLTHPSSQAISPSPVTTIPHQITLGREKMQSRNEDTANRSRVITIPVPPTSADGRRYMSPWKPSQGTQACEDKKDKIDREMKAQAMEIPWRAMHREMGASEMARRALTTNNSISRGNSGSSSQGQQLPSLAEMIAGVPADPTSRYPLP